MTWATPAQGKPDGQGIPRCDMFYTSTVGGTTVKLRTPVQPQMYGFDPAGAGTSATNAIYSIMGLKFYGDTSTALETADEGSVLTDAEDAISQGLLCPVKITYTVPIAGATGVNARKRKQTTRLLCPVSKLPDLMKNAKGRVLYENLDVESAGFYS